MKAEIFSHYSYILDGLIIRHDFAKYYFQSPFSLDYCFKEEEIDVKIACGATRGCLIDEAYNWVVKFDLGECGVNTCKKENNIYEAAMRDGVEKFFAEPIYLGTYCREINFFDAYDFDSYEYENVCDWEDDDFIDTVSRMDEPHLITIELPLYAYPRANSFSPNGILNVGKARRELGMSPLTERNIVVGYEFARAYGADEYAKLVEFLKKEGVNDLHSGNVGTIAGKPILIDYCGYEEDY